MKPIASREQLLRLEPNVFSQFRTDRITQILPPDSNIGGMVRRGKSFSSIATHRPYVVISINPFDPITGLRNIDDLRKIVCRSSIVTFDTYAVDDNINTSSTQVDPFNVYGLLYATRGRLVFDLESYITSEIQLDLYSAIGTRTELKIRVEIFSKEDSPSYGNYANNRLAGPNDKPKDATFGHRTTRLSKNSGLISSRNTSGNNGRRNR